MPSPAVTRRIAADRARRLGGAITGGLNAATLTGNLTLTISSKPFQRLDPGGASRTVTLPAVSHTAGLFFEITNVADADERLTINNSAGALVAYALPGDTVVLVSNGSAWSVARRSTVGLRVPGVSGAVTATTLTAHAGAEFVVPANHLAVGDIVHVRAHFHVLPGASGHTHTLQSRMYIGPTATALASRTEICTSGSVDDVEDNQIWAAEAWVRFSTVGASGNCAPTVYRGLYSEGPSSTLRQQFTAAFALPTDASITVSCASVWAGGTEDSVVVREFFAEVIKV
jgi:hypothetical protein